MSLSPQSARHHASRPGQAAPARVGLACAALAGASPLLGACGSATAAHHNTAARSTTTRPAAPTSTRDRPSTTPPTTTTPAPTTTTDPLPHPPRPDPGRVTIVGDSV